jgi:hypothetical protein
LVDRDNSIHVLDAQLGRYSRFDGDGVYQGSARTQIIAGFGKPAVLLVGGRLVVNDPPLVAERRYVLKVMDREGRTLHQFDEAPANARRDSWAMDRLLWPGSNGGLLVGKPFAFTVDVYDRDFRKTFSMRRSAEWIPVANSSEPPSDGLFDQRATAQLRGLWEDEAGLLWLLMILPSAVWTPGPSRDEGMQLAEEAIADLARRPRVETLIEVIDQETQRVVTRWKPDHNIGTPFSGGYFATPVLDSVGTPSLRITRLKLNRTEG